MDCQKLEMFHSSFGAEETPINVHRMRARVDNQDQYVRPSGVIASITVAFSLPLICAGHEPAGPLRCFRTRSATHSADCC